MGHSTGPNVINVKTKQKQPLVVMQWNAEGVNSKKDGFSKKLELENYLFTNAVSICCIQETHLPKDQTFKIRGYKCLRQDRLDRRKGGILTLVRSGIDPHETQVHMEGAEFQTIRIKTQSTEFNLVNYYCPNDRPLSLDTINPTEKLLICGDFNL